MGSQPRSTHVPSLSKKPEIQSHVEVKFVFFGVGTADYCSFSFEDDAEWIVHTGRIWGWRYDVYWTNHFNGYCCARHFGCQ